MMSDLKSRSQRIAALNDEFRAGRLPAAGRMFCTSGVDALGPEFVAHVLGAVQSFTAFSTDNDPYGEHDFGSFEVNSEQLFWKIDYYNDLSLRSGSEDPADQTKSYRVLTIMLMSEY